MTLTTRGKCEVCKASCRETKDFPTTVDLFNPTAEPKITVEVQANIKAWRDKPMYCREHK